MIRSSSVRGLSLVSSLVPSFALLASLSLTPACDGGKDKDTKAGDKKETEEKAPVKERDPGTSIDSVNTDGPDISGPVPPETSAVFFSVDGALIPWEIIPALKLQDQTEYQVEGHDMTRFGTTIFQVSMNLDKWNSLPEDVQKAFVDNSNEEWLAKAADIWRQIDDGGIKVATDAGNTHIQLTEEETQAFQTVLEPVVDRWVNEVDGKGIDGATLVSKARELISANSAK